MAAEKAARKELKEERVQAMVTKSTLERLQKMADEEGRSLSGMAAHILTQHCGRRAK